MDTHDSISKPLITLIIPVFNVCSYLHQCLDSVVMQTYENLEVLVIDDGSTDGSGNICDEYAARYRNITVFHIENNGLSAARNFGLEHQKQSSEYVAFLDSDDWLEVDAIEKLYNAASKYNSKLVSCLHYNEYLDGALPSAELSCAKIYENDEFKDAFIQTSYIGDVAWNKLYKRELFQYIRYPFGRIYEDVATTYRIVDMVDKAVVIPEMLIHYRIRNDSLSRDKSIPNLVDCWTSYFEKYKHYYMMEIKATSYQHLISDCLNTIYRLWDGLLFKHTEHQKIKKVLHDISIFAKAHRHDVITGEYTKLQKYTCLFASLRLSVFMIALILTNRTVIVYRNLIKPSNHRI